MFEPDAEKAGEPKRDFGKMFDLDRSTLIKSFVDRMEALMRDVKASQDDLREVLAEASVAEFSRRDIDAMKAIAKLRLDDKGGAAREKLEAMSRVGRAVGFDLFDWASNRV